MRRTTYVLAKTSEIEALAQVTKKPIENRVQNKKVIDLARQRLGNSGRLVIRPSGTEPVIRVMAEGDDEGLVRNIVDELCGVIAKAAA